MRLGGCGMWAASRALLSACRPACVATDIVPHCQLLRTLSCDMPLPAARLCAQVSRALTGKAAADVLGADSYALRRLRADVQMQLTAFKNAAYTAGYKAGKDEVVAFATNRYR